MLAKRKGVCILDVENLTLSSRDIGYELTYASLFTIFQDAMKHVHLHAVLSIEESDDVDVDHLNDAGLIVHTRLIRRHADGKSANADNRLAFVTGLLVSRSDADDIIIGSGDGDLVCDLAEAIHSLPRERKVWTMSLPGSTNHRLNAALNPLIAGNIEIGLDVLAPIGWRTLRRPA
jgi:hypothetical protein